MSDFTLTDFMRESLRIEDIHREPTDAEMAATKRFLALDRVHVADICALVSVYAPGHVLRDRADLNVRVGHYIAPRGGPAIANELDAILADARGQRTYPHSWKTHHRFETLHPFTDGNGRSGRALWLWQVGGKAPLGFLHHWYYQSLENSPFRSVGRARLGASGSQAHGA